MKSLFSSIVLLLFTSMCLAQTGGSTSPISSFPYVNNFEVGIVWSQSSGDDFDWSRLSGSTPSSGAAGNGNHTATLTINDSTAPTPQSGGTSSGSCTSTVTVTDSTAPTPQSGGTSSGSCTSTVTVTDSTTPTPKSAILISPVFDIRQLSGAQMSFIYRVLGTNQVLELEASTGGTNWSVIWSSTGNTGTTWGTAVIDLRNYQAANNLQLRFKGTIFPTNTSSNGTTWQGDMAIDDISLSSSGGSRTKGRRTALTTGTELGIKAFPNPFQDNFSLTIPNLENQTATVALYNASGKQIFFKSEVQPGSSIKLYPKGLPGLYVLHVAIGKEQFCVKLIKTE